MDEAHGTFHISTLGCPKNEVDSDVLATMLINEGWRMEADPRDADVMIVNTCSFIVPAVEESIEFIFELSELKQEESVLLVVAGCLVSRYGATTLASLLPEVDLFVGIEEYDTFITGVENMIGKTRCKGRAVTGREYASTLPKGYVFLKISEGCDRRCAYCSIPSIRGPLRSRRWEDICREGRFFLERGARELILIAQDTTSYGLDIYGEACLPMLIDRLCELEGDWRLRVMYTHPEGISEELLRALEHPSVCNYLDIPFQHADPNILEAMGRKGGGDRYRTLLDRVGEYLGEIALRATFMVGFPGEGESEFESLYRFVAESCFDWLGLFSYSQEEGTPAFSLGRGVPAPVTRSRVEELSVLQEEIMRENASRLVGREMRVLLESRSLEAPGFWEARSWREAPEIDGVIFVTDCEEMEPGCFYDIEITASEGIDLVGVTKTRQEQADDDGRGG
jgi:ribosomal protein S12 methylthiotransferase